MNTDAAFTIGKTHDVCEDYATNYSPEGTSQIILCDGCSSSDLSDIGARILALTAANELKYNAPTQKFIERVIARLPISLFGLTGQTTKTTILDATLLCAYPARLLGCSVIEVLIIGDGFVIVEGLDGSLDVYHYEYPSGYPRYLSYELDERRKKEFEKHNFGLNITRNIGAHGPYIEKENIDLSDRVFPAKVFPVNNIKTITLASDGLASFSKITETETSKSQVSIPYMDVIRKLLPFKNTQGKFVQRRLNRFKKDCELLGWQHHDDISLATIAME